MRPEKVQRGSLLTKQLKFLHLLTQTSAVRNGNCFFPGQYAPQSSDSSIHVPVSPHQLQRRGKTRAGILAQTCVSREESFQTIPVKNTWVLTEWVISSETPATNLLQVWSSLRFQNFRETISEFQRNNFYRENAYLEWAGPDQSQAVFIFEFTWRCRHQSWRERL